MRKVGLPLQFILMTALPTARGDARGLSFAGYVLDHSLKLSNDHHFSSEALMQNRGSALSSR